MPDDCPILKVAAVQASPIYLDREGTVEKACRLITEAAGNGAKIIAFPESYIAGYPYFYLTLLTNPFLEHGKWFRRLFKSAVEVPSPATEKLCQAARESKTYVIIGINEKNDMGVLYNSQLFIDHKGHILGVHRKLFPTLFEKMLYASGDGSDLHIFKTDWGEMGGLICGEHTSSLAKFSLIARGEKIHVASWPAFPQRILPKHQNETVLFRVRQHAHEGKIFVISSSGHFSPEMIDVLCKTEEERARIQVGGGCSAIVGVNGEFLGGPLFDREGIVYAEINLEDRVEAKLSQDMLGYSSRFDVLALYFNEAKLAPIRYRVDKFPQEDKSGNVIQSLEQRFDLVEGRLGSFLDNDEGAKFEGFEGDE